MQRFSVYHAATAALEPTLGTLVDAIYNRAASVLHRLMFMRAAIPA
jgi:hypothetical protein